MLALRGASNVFPIQHISATLSSSWEVASTWRGFLMPFHACCCFLCFRGTSTPVKSYLPKFLWDKTFGLAVPVVLPVSSEEPKVSRVGFVSLHQSASGWQSAVRSSVLERSKRVAFLLKTASPYFMQNIINYLSKHPLICGEGDVILLLISCSFYPVSSYQEVDSIKFGPTKQIIRYAILRSAGAYVCISVEHHKILPVPGRSIVGPHFFVHGVSRRGPK